MILAVALPSATANLPESTVAPLTLFGVACHDTFRSASQAADFLHIDPQHHAQLGRFFAR